MTTPMDPSSAGSQGASGDSSDDSQGLSFAVIIAVMSDGTYQITTQDADDSGDDGDSEDNAPQTADSVDEALEIAKQLLASESAEDSGAGADGNAPIPPDQTKSVWDQMASSRAKQKASQQ